MFPKDLRRLWEYLGFFWDPATLSDDRVSENGLYGRKQVFHLVCRRSSHGVPRKLKKSGIGAAGSEKPSVTASNVSVDYTDTHPSKRCGTPAHIASVPVS